MAGRTGAEFHRGVTRVFLIAAARERERLGELLEEAGAEVVGAAASAEGATEELVETADVVIVGTNGELEEVLEVLQAQGLTGTLPIVLLMTEQRTAAWANRALRAGVRGILPRNLSATRMHVALEAVAQGLTVLETSDHSLRGNDGEAAEFVEPLTARERDVLEMLAQGRGNREIAAQLRISEHTVKFHVASILGKLGAATRTEAVSIALRRGLILF